MGTDVIHKGLMEFAWNYVYFHKVSRHLRIEVWSRFVTVIVCVKAHSGEVKMRLTYSHLESPSHLTHSTGIRCSLFWHVAVNLGRVWSLRQDDVSRLDGRRGCLAGAALNVVAWFRTLFLALPRHVLHVP
jgi:hypothetical protein